MVDASTHDRRRLVRQIFLVLAVVMVLMTAAATAGASRLTGPIGTANSPRTAAIVKQHAQAPSILPCVGWCSAPKAARWVESVLALARRGHRAGGLEVPGGRVAARCCLFERTSTTRLAVDAGLNRIRARRAQAM
jgi:hypothetical protein